MSTGRLGRGSALPAVRRSSRPRGGCAREAGGIRVHGFVAALAEHGPTRGPQHVFVNRRIVKDKTIAHAIFDAYSVASNKERSPEVHLFLEIPPERIDVNVHPTKAEVRFKEQSLVHEVVRRAVADALGSGPAPELTLRPSEPRAGAAHAPRASLACSAAASYTNGGRLGTGVQSHGGSKHGAFTDSGGSQHGRSARRT